MIQGFGKQARIITNTYQSSLKGINVGAGITSPSANAAQKAADQLSSQKPPIMPSSSTKKSRSTSRDVSQPECHKFKNLVVNNHAQSTQKDPASTSSNQKKKSMMVESAALTTTPSAANTNLKEKRRSKSKSKYKPSAANQISSGVKSHKTIRPLASERQSQHTIQLVQQSINNTGNAVQQHQSLQLLELMGNTNKQVQAQPLVTTSSTYLPNTTLNSGAITSTISPSSRNSGVPVVPHQQSTANITPKGLLSTTNTQQFQATKTDQNKQGPQQHTLVDLKYIMNGPSNFATVVAGGCNRNNYRHRSTSNQQQQLLQHQKQTTNFSMQGRTGASDCLQQQHQTFENEKSNNVLVMSVTEHKRKEPSQSLNTNCTANANNAPAAHTVTKRKKSMTKRGKSIKRTSQQTNQQQVIHIDSHQHQTTSKHNRSPNTRNNLVVVHSNAAANSNGPPQSERHQSPPTSIGGASTIYSAYRSRAALKPRKSGREGTTKPQQQQQPHHQQQSQHDGTSSQQFAQQSVSSGADKNNELQFVTPANIALFTSLDAKMMNVNMFQHHSTSASQSICSKETTPAAAVNQQTTATVGINKTNSSKNVVLKQPQQKLSTSGTTSNKVRRISNKTKAMQTERKKNSSDINHLNNHQRIDLLKASILTTIDLSANRLQKQSFVSNTAANIVENDDDDLRRRTPSPTSSQNQQQKAMKLIKAKNGNTIRSNNIASTKVFVKHRSISSDEMLLLRPTSAAQHEMIYATTASQNNHDNNANNNEENRHNVTKIKQKSKRQWQQMESKNAAAAANSTRKSHQPQDQMQLSKQQRYFNNENNLRNNKNCQQDATKTTQNRSNSPKFLLSLRQLEDLLLSTQKISAQLRASTVTVVEEQEKSQAQQKRKQEGRNQQESAAILAKKTLIQNSLKYLSNQHEVERDQKDLLQRVIPHKEGLAGATTIGTEDSAVKTTTNQRQRKQKSQKLPREKSLEAESHQKQNHLPAQQASEETRVENDEKTTQEMAQILAPTKTLSTAQAQSHGQDEAVEEPVGLQQNSARGVISKRQQTNLVSLIDMQKSRAQHLLRQQQPQQLKRSVVVVAAPTTVSASKAQDENRTPSAAIPVEIKHNQPKESLVAVKSCQESGNDLQIEDGENGLQGVQDDKEHSEISAKGIVVESSCGGEPKKVDEFQSPGPSLGRQRREESCGIEALGASGYEEGGEIMTIEDQQCSMIEQSREADDQVDPSSQSPSPELNKVAVTQHPQPRYVPTQKRRPASVNLVIGKPPADETQQTQFLIGYENRRQPMIGLISASLKGDHESNRGSSSGRTLADSQRSAVKIENQQQNDSDDDEGELSAVSPAMVQIELQMRGESVATIESGGSAEPQNQRQKSSVADSRSIVMQSSQSAINMMDQSYLERVSQQQAYQQQQQQQFHQQLATSSRTGSQSRRSKGAAPILGATQELNLQNPVAMLINEEMIDQQKDESQVSICSLKQPSLRQITSSHKSSSTKRLHCQESTEHRKSQQDPNASITLSRLLLETSMQQSERGGGLVLGCATTTAAGHHHHLNKMPKAARGDHHGAIAAYSSACNNQLNAAASNTGAGNFNQPSATALQIQRNRSNEIQSMRLAGTENETKEMVDNKRQMRQVPPEFYQQDHQQLQHEEVQDESELSSVHGADSVQQSHQKKQSVSHKNQIQPSSSKEEMIRHDQSPLRPHRQFNNFMADEAWPQTSGTALAHPQHNQSANSRNDSKQRELQLQKQKRSQQSSPSSCRSIHLSPQQVVKKSSMQPQQRQQHRHQEDQLYSPISQKTLLQLDEVGQEINHHLDSGQRSNKASPLLITSANHCQQAKKKHSSTQEVDFRQLMHQEGQQQKVVAATSNLEPQVQDQEVEADGEKLTISSKPTGSVTESSPLNSSNAEKKAEQNQQQYLDKSIASTANDKGGEKVKERLIGTDETVKTGGGVNYKKVDGEVLSVRGTSSPDKRASRIKNPIEYEPQDSKSFVMNDDDDDVDQSQSFPQNDHQLQQNFIIEDDYDDTGCNISGGSKVQDQDRSPCRQLPLQQNEQQFSGEYEEAPFEKSRHDTEEGLNLILFGRDHQTLDDDQVRIGRIDGHSRAISQENLLSSIHSSTQDYNNYQSQHNHQLQQQPPSCGNAYPYAHQKGGMSSSTRQHHQNHQLQSQQEKIQVLTPRQQKNVALQLTMQRSVGAASDPTSTSGLAAMEDVLGGLSPTVTNTNDNHFNEQMGAVDSLETNLMRGVGMQEPAGLRLIARPHMINHQTSDQLKPSLTKPCPEVAPEKRTTSDEEKGSGADVRDDGRQGAEIAVVGEKVASAAAAAAAESNQEARLGLPVGMIVLAEEKNTNNTCQGTTNSDKEQKLNGIIGSKNQKRTLKDRLLEKYCEVQEFEDIDEGSDQQPIRLHRIRDITSELPLELADLKSVRLNAHVRQTPEPHLVPTMMTQGVPDQLQLNSDQKPRTESRAATVSSSQATHVPLATSTTHDLEFEEADNCSESPVPTIMSLPQEAQQKHPPPEAISVQQISNPLKQLQDGAGTAKNRLFDIDSLNAIKKANDLASKKVEFTNQIFENLVKEITNDLFPARSNQRRRSKGKKRRRSVKPSVQPKVKEIVNGQPVDMCLRRIQVQASSKLRQSLAMSLEGSQSATYQSVSTLSRDGGERMMSSYLDHTKSKDQLLNEASSQFYLIEQRKQEQNDLLIKLINEANCQNTKASAIRLKNKKQSQSPNLRGIKTTTDVLLSYLNTLFDQLMEDENGFLEGLATPFPLNTLQELVNLQVLSRHSASQPRQLMTEKGGVGDSSPTIGSSGGGRLATLALTSHLSSTQQQLQDQELEIALYGHALNQQPILSVEIYLEIERKKEYVLLADSISDIEDDDEDDDDDEQVDLDGSDQQQQIDKDGSPINNGNKGEDKPKPAKKQKKAKESLEENQSMLAEWENIHNKVLFDAVNDALDNYRPYGQKGPPAPWSGQTRALTYRYSQNAKEVLDHVRDKVVNLSKTFGGALANSELLREYHIRGPLDEDKLMMLREERLAIMMMQDVEETQQKWDDLERQESGIKIDLAEMILDELAREIAEELSQITNARQSFSDP